MDRSTEIELLEEFAGLREACAFYLDDAVATSPVARYTCPGRFSRERQVLFRELPPSALRSFLLRRCCFLRCRAPIEVRHSGKPFDACHPGMALPVDDPGRDIPGCSQ